MVVVHIIEPFASGVALFVKSLTTVLNNEEHIVIHGERKDEIEAHLVKKGFLTSNVKFIPWRSAHRKITISKDVKALFEIYSILKRLKKSGLCDVVHLHSAKSGFLGRIACKMLGIKNVFYTPNGASFLSTNSNTKRFIFKTLEVLANKLCGKVICSSASEFNEYKKLGIKALYVNNGVETVERKEQLDTNTSEKFRIITCGRIVAQKDPELFNEIASYFVGLDNFEFVWIGDGPDAELLQAKNIKITGWLDENAVHHLIRSGDVYLSTSQYEGLSFAALEAMSLKKALLLTDCVGNRDIIRQGVNGDLFSNKRSAITKIIHYQNNREMLLVMGEHSKDIKKTEYDMYSNFRIYRDIYLGRATINNKLMKRWTFN
jgi:glycosyltransferase involved in cell wall biosynthesis